MAIDCLFGSNWGMAEPADDHAAAAAKRLPPDERRRHLTEVALGLFADGGYTETELGDVADAAGIRRPLLYHYFDGKEDLYVAVLEHAWAQLASQMAVEPGSGTGVMPSNMLTYLDLVEAGDPAARVVRQARHLDLPRVAETTRIASVGLAHGMALNHLGPGEPSEPAIAVMQAYLGFFEGLIEEWMTGRMDRSQVEIVLIETLPAAAASARRLDPGL
jgi:AcrR family transcriptional regulator